MFVNVPETSLLSRKTWNFEQILSETLLCKCSSGHIEVSFEIPAQFFPVNSKFFLVNVQNWWQISYPKTFFPEFFSDGHLPYSFDKRAIIFPLKDQVSLLKVRKIEKKQFFKVKFPQMFPLNTCIAVLAHLDSSFATGQKKLLQIQISNKKHSFSGKRIDFPENFPVDARMAFVTTLKKIFWIKLFFLSQIPRKFETMCKVSNMFFSSKSSKAT